MNELLLRRSMMGGGANFTTVTLYPSSYDDVNSTYRSISTTYPITNGYTGTSSDTFARIFINTGQGAETKFYFTFDTSTIPSNAIIKSVVMKTKVTIQTAQTTAIATRTQQVCIGTVEKGATSIFNTNVITRTLDTSGSWTLSDLADISLYLRIVRGTTSTATNFQIDFYGADLIVKYKLPPEDT